VQTGFGINPPTGVAFQIVQATDVRPDLACTTQATAALNNGATNAYCYFKTDCQGNNSAVLYGTCTAAASTSCETPLARSDALTRKCEALNSVIDVSATTASWPTCQPAS
jgi:hypothetical protein